jgi:methanogenic corrinoid protein MtbC1
MVDPISPDLPAMTLPDPATPGGVASPEFIAALLADGDDDLAAWAIGQALEEQPRAVVFDDVIRRAMELVGSRWVSGEWSISQEHLASVALLQALARVRSTTGPEMRVGPVAVLATPEGEQHVAGLACLAQVLEEDGWRVENLGANVPADELVQFVTERSVDLLALSIGTPGRVPALQRTLDALRAADSETARRPIMVGGSGIAGVEAEIRGADLVSTSLADAEQFARELARLRDQSTTP